MLVLIPLWPYKTTYILEYDEDLGRATGSGEIQEDFMLNLSCMFVFALIYREFKNDIPDAPQLLHTFLVAESDSACKRNAFVFLAHCSMLEYILSI
jgi:hypothetical protein